MKRVSEQDERVVDTLWTPHAGPCQESRPEGPDTDRGTSGSSRDPQGSGRTGSGCPEIAIEGTEVSNKGVTIDDAVSEALSAISDHPNHDPKTGKFLAGNTAAGKTLARSEVFWSAVREAKTELVDRLRSDLTIDGQAAATMEGLTDAYAEARLLRHAMFTRLVEMGGPITTKGRTRALFSSYLATLDREVRLATTLGLERRSKRIDPLDAIAEAVREANR